MESRIETMQINEASQEGVRPRRSRTLRALGQKPDGRVVVLDPTGPNWAALSPTAALVLGACDGTRTIRDLARVFESDLPGRGREAAVQEAVRYLDKLGLLDGEDERETTPPRAPRLELASIHLTQACNLRCKYCLYSSGTPLPNELSTEQFCALLESLSGLNVEHVMFIGGEPLMRGDLFDIALYGKELGLCISLLTNGVLIDERASARIRECFDGGVQVSLDGFQAHNDRMRGQGTFEKVVGAIKLLLADGVDTVVSSTLSNVNADHLDEFIAFLVDLGVPSFNITDLLSYGRGKGVSASRMRAIDANKLLLTAWRRWKDHIRFDQVGEFLPHKWHRRLKCGAGEGAIEIASDGHVYACEKKLILNEPAGNILSTDLARIYCKSPVLLQTREMRVDRDPVCSLCEFRYMCGGGCLVERPSDLDRCELREALHWRLLELEI